MWFSLSDFEHMGAASETQQKVSDSLEKPKQDVWASQICQNINISTGGDYSVYYTFPWSTL